MSITTQSNQPPVPVSRTWVLRRTSGGLKAEGNAKGLQVGEAALFAFNFSHDLPHGATISTITTLALEIGTNATLDSDQQGIDRSSVKVHVTAVSVGTVRIRCKVSYSDGSAVEGDGALTIVAA